jgi:catalase
MIPFYFDTQISRLDINWEELRINRLFSLLMNLNRDGAMRHQISNSTVNYWQNRFEALPPSNEEEGVFASYSEKA